MAEVVKATRIMIDGHPAHEGSKKAASPRKPAWLLEQNDRFEYVFLHGGTAAAQRALDKHGRENWGLSSDCDVWTYCPPEDWPDEVCVAVAQYGLIGKVTS